jgi:2'-5' RNA ligase
MARHDDSARLFFALAVDTALASRLARLALRVAEAAGGRATPAANLHATVAFLGNVPVGSFDALRAIAAHASAAAWAAPCDVLLDRVGGFRAARVVWIGPSVVPAVLVALQAELSRRLVEAGFAPDSRAWQPHVTLARHCRHTFGATSVAPMHWRVDGLTLYESQGAPGGPCYVARGRWPA